MRFTTRMIQQLLAGWAVETECESKMSLDVKLSSFPRFYHKRLRLTRESRYTRASLAGVQVWNAIFFSKNTHDSVLRSMWMARLGLPMIFCAWGSQNKFNFHPLRTNYVLLYRASKISLVFFSFFGRSTHVVPIWCTISCLKSAFYTCKPGNLKLSLQ